MVVVVMLMMMRRRKMIVVLIGDMLVVAMMMTTMMLVLLMLVNDAIVTVDVVIYANIVAGNDQHAEAEPNKIRLTIHRAAVAADDDNDSSERNISTFYFICHCTH